MVPNIKLDLQYDLENLTPANASPVDANFDRVEQHVNAEVIERDGSVAMRAQLKLIGDPIADLDAAPKQYVDAIIPVGLVMMYGGTTNPPGGKWAICNGAEVETAAFPELFNVLGYAYGGSGGRFKIPNLVDHFPLGAGTLAARGVSGGSKDQTVPTHTHTINHDHAQATSSNNSISHTHSIEHNHPPITTSADSHTHNLRGAEVNGSGGSLGLFLNADYETTSYGVVGNTSADSHTHTANMVTYTGSSGIQSANHTHTVNLPSFSGTSGTTGVTPTNANMPPYVGIAYVIRVR